MKTSVLIRSYGCGEVVWLRMSASPTRAGMPTAPARRQQRRVADAEAALRRADPRKSSADLIFLKATGRQPYGLSMSGDMDVFQPAGRNAQMRCASPPRSAVAKKSAALDQATSRAPAPAPNVHDRYLGISIARP